MTARVPLGSAATVNVMARVLVTGMSGVGKTTVLHELRRRGHHTVDTDYDGWELLDGTSDERRMDRMLARHPDVIERARWSCVATFALGIVLIIRMVLPTPL